MAISFSETAYPDERCILKAKALIEPDQLVMKNKIVMMKCVNVKERVL